MFAVAVFAWTAPSDQIGSSFRVVTAIVVVGYLMFPLLALLAAGLLLIALLLFLAHLEERRRLRP